MCRHGITISVLFGTLLGAISALVWFFGFVPYVRAVIPYALLFSILLFITTAILKAKCGSPRQIEDSHNNPTCRSVSLYSTLILIVAAIFIVFSFVVLATSLPFVVKTILAFIGSISFWMMLLSYVAMIICIFKRHCH